MGNELCILQTSRVSLLPLEISLINLILMGSKLYIFFYLIIGMSGQFLCLIFNLLPIKIKSINNISNGNDETRMFIILIIYYQSRLSLLTISPLEISLIDLILMGNELYIL
jgi:hypothetical protein